MNLDMIESQTGIVIEKIYQKAEDALSVQAFDEDNVLFSKLRPYLNKVVLPDDKGLATTELVPLRPNPKNWIKYSLFTYYAVTNLYHLPMRFPEELKCLECL